MAAALPAGQALLGGERGGLRIAGFDLGNSPAEYTPQRVAGKTIVLTTTNGTRAIHQCRLARRTLIGAFVSAAALVEQLVREERVCLICAGTQGEVSRDDLLLAGLLVERLQRRSGLNCRLSDEAAAAREDWLRSFPMPAAASGLIEPERLAAELADSPGGRNLLAVGLEADILAAARLDLFARVPQWLPDQMRIRLA